MGNERTYHTQKKTLLLEGVLKAHTDERLTVRAIASKFGLSPTTVQRWIVNFAPIRRRQIYERTFTSGTKEYQSGRIWRNWPSRQNSG